EIFINVRAKRLALGQNFTNDRAKRLVVGQIFINDREKRLTRGQNFINDRAKSLGVGEKLFKRKALSPASREISQARPPGTRPGRVKRASILFRRRLTPLLADQRFLARIVDRMAHAVDVRHRFVMRSEEHTSELQSRENLVCRLL